MMFNKSLSTRIVLAIVISSAAAYVRAADDSKPAKTQPSSDSNPTGPSADLESFKSRVMSLNLTEEQKTKLDGYFQAAEEGFKELADQPESAERKQKAHVLSVKLRGQVSVVLTKDQKIELGKKAPPPVDNTSATIDRIKAELDKPESKLTDDQKKKADALLDETKQKIADLRTQAQKSNTDVSAKVQDVLKDMKQKLAAILNGSGK